jgi:Mn-dependent DtxR family transcriptional regulator
MVRTLLLNTMQDRGERLRRLREAHASEMEARGDAISSRVEDHLEVIHELIVERGEARVAEIADHLAVSRPTVTRMLQKMAEDGWVEYQKYKPVKLTEKGLEHAEWMRHRHTILVRFLTLLGLSDGAAHFETEGIEHHLQSDTINRIERLVEEGNFSDFTSNAVRDMDEVSDS